MKAIMKYPGSKWSIADWIISHFPEHHSYLEAFFGSGAVLFNKPRSNIETVNDLDGNVVNLFENKPAVELIQRFNFPNVLIYADPPYVLGTRNGKQYRCEMNDPEQVILLEVLLLHKGPVIISGYDNNLYNDMLRGWHKEETVCYSQICSKKKEVLWMNFEPDGQMTLDDFQEVMP